MGTTTASCNGGGGEASLPSDGVEKPEMMDKTGWDAHRHTTSHDAGIIDTANVACTSDIWHAALHSMQQIYDKLT